MKTFSIFLILSFVASCAKDTNLAENNDLNKLKNLTGKWKAVSLFLSDANTGVCYENKTARDVTFEFSNKISDEKGNYTFSGSAPVNQYFGKIKLLSFDEKTNIGKIEISNIGGTKMAGSPEMMDCEQSFYTLLAESTGYQLFENEPSRLIIGRLKEPNSNPRDGGTYYIFEKMK